MEEEEGIQEEGMLLSYRLEASLTHTPSRRGMDMEATTRVLLLLRSE